MTTTRFRPGHDVDHLLSTTEQGSPTITTTPCFQLHSNFYGITSGCIEEPNAPDRMYEPQRCKMVSEKEKILNRAAYSALTNSSLPLLDPPTLAQLLASSRLDVRRSMLIKTITACPHINVWAESRLNSLRRQKGVYMTMCKAGTKRGCQHCGRLHAKERDKGAVLWP
jgi:hypothetical protein